MKREHCSQMGSMACRKEDHVSSKVRGQRNVKARLNGKAELRPLKAQASHISP